MKFDELDKRILLQLQQNSALTNHELAARVHASPPTCLRRVKRLTDEGVITRQVALLAPEKLGPSLTAIVEITLDHQATENLLEFEKLVAAESTVQQCYRVSRLFATQSNIRNVRSFFSIVRSKFETQIEI